MLGASWKRLRVRLGEWKRSSQSVRQTVRQTNSLLGDNCSIRLMQWKRIGVPLRATCPKLKRECQKKKKGGCFSLLVSGQLWCDNRDDLINGGFKKAASCVCAARLKSRFYLTGVLFVQRLLHSPPAAASYFSPVQISDLSAPIKPSSRLNECF